MAKKRRRKFSIKNRQINSHQRAGAGKSVHRKSGRKTENPVQNVSLEQPFRLGKWLVEHSEGQLPGRGESVPLEPGVMEVLAHLARRQGKDVSRGEL